MKASELFREMLQHPWGATALLLWKRCLKCCTKMSINLASSDIDSVRHSRGDVSSAGTTENIHFENDRKW